MADLQSLSPIPENQSRQTVEDWLDLRSAVFAELLAGEILKITTAVFEEFIQTVDETTVLTASGDPNVVDSVIPRWAVVAQRVVAPYISETYLAGALFAYTIADSKNLIPARIAAAWAPVMNEAARQYALKAENRLRGVGDTLWKEMRKKVAGAIESGASGETLKQEIETLANFSEFRADTVARTETSIAYSNGNFESDQALGEYGPAEKIWVAVGDARTRAAHLAAMAASEANPVPFSEPFIVGGVPMMHPHSPGAPAKEVVNCRCYYESLYVGDTRPDGSIVGENTMPQAQVAGQPLPPVDYEYKVMPDDWQDWSGADDAWQRSGDRAIRATGVWQAEIETQQAVRQIVTNIQRNQPELDGVTQLSERVQRRMGYAFDAAREEQLLMTGDDLLNEARLSARWLVEQFDTNLTTQTDSLYRGMVVEDVDEFLLGLGNEGDVISLPISSFTTSLKEARIYTEPRGKLRGKVIVEMEPGAKTLDLSPTATGNMRTSREQLAPSGSYRLVRKGTDEQGITRIVIAAV